MSRTALLTALLAGAATMAFAQESGSTPKMEVGLNFSTLTTNPGAGFSSFVSPGGSGTFIYNINHYLGAVADLGGYHNGSVTDFSPTTFSYLFGPRVNLRRSRVTPYVQALFGGARLSTNLLDPNTGNSLAAQNGFAQAYGGGVDFRVNDHFAVKPFQIEYLRTNVPNIWEPEGSQNNVRYSAGVVFRFGSK